MIREGKDSSLNWQTKGHATCDTEGRANDMNSDTGVYVEQTALETLETEIQNAEDPRYKSVDHVDAQSQSGDEKQKGHAGNGTTSLLCPVCGVMVINKFRLTYHIQSKHHLSDNHKCDYCNYSHYLSGNLKRHMRIHTGERPYLCSYCGQGFQCETNQKVHERTHTGEKPYKCSYCGKRFAQKASHVKHERVHTGERPYACNQCGKCFRDSGDRTRCQKAHLGIRRIRQKKPTVSEEIIPPGQVYQSDPILHAGPPKEQAPAFVTAEPSSASGYPVPNLTYYL